MAKDKESTRARETNAAQPKDPGLLDKKKKKKKGDFDLQERLQKRGGENQNRRVGSTEGPKKKSRGLKGTVSPRLSQALFST